MKAENLRIAKVFSSGGDIHYVLPHFQREYTWGKENWQTLLDDALAVYTESQPPTAGGQAPEVEHFLGSIVVIHDGLRGGTISALKLVDGQQRLMTIALLLKALCLLVASAHPTLVRRLEKLLVNADEEGELFFKILPTTKSGDRTSYCALLRNEALPQNGSRVSEAFTFFSEAIADNLTNGLDPERFAGVITNAFQVVFVELDERESPYRIFESLNAKGKPLTQGDLVRNYVAMRLPAKDQERVFTTYWSKTENLLAESRNVGRLTELTAFLRHYHAMHTGVLCDQQHVYARFRDRAEKEFPEASQFEAELVEISRFALHYDTLLRPETYGNGSLATALQRLNALESSSAYPFLMRLLDELRSGRLSDTTVFEVMSILETYMVRRYLADEPANYLNRIFPTLWAALDSSDVPGSLRKALAERKCPSNGRVVRSISTRTLYDKSGLVRRKTALILEAVNRRLSAGSGGFTVLDDSATIEHIMPQTLNDPWREMLGPMSEQVHSDFLHVLGNLTLVTGEWNSELSNGNFTKKKARLASHALRLNSTFFSQAIDRWGREEIESRGEALAAVILEVWPTLQENDEEADDLLKSERRYSISEFHLAAAEKVALKVGASFKRVTECRYETSDGAHRLVGLCSKPYERGSGAKAYWFGFKIAQKDFLTHGGNSWLAVECENPINLFLFPYPEFEELLPHLNKTNDLHWHLSIRADAEQFRLALPKLRQFKSLEPYRV